MSAAEQRYWLASHVHVCVCVTGNYAVLLDLSWRSTPREGPQLGGLGEFALGAQLLQERAAMQCGL